MEPYGIIYLLIDGTNDMEYVGQTIQTFERRFSGHLCGNQYIDNAIRKHGADMFATAILKVCYSQEELNYYERHFVKYRNTMAPNGYNLTEGGDRDYTVSDETRAKLSVSQTGKKHTPEHCAKIAAAGRRRKQTPESRAKISAANTGKKRTPETCAKISAARRARPQKPLSPETYARIAAANTGKKRTPETCARISAALTGKKHTPEHCAKISASCTGQKRTPETCARISAALTGRTRSQEHCANISAAKRHDSPYKNLLAELDARQMSYSALAKLMGFANTVSISERMRDVRGFTERDKAKLPEIFGKPIEYLLQRFE